MSGPFKMKGWSPFTQKIHPKHPVTPPTTEESKKSKGELREAKPNQWETTKKTVKAKLKAGTFWGWPIDKWGGGKR